MIRRFSIDFPVSNTAKLTVSGTTLHESLDVEMKLAATGFGPNETPEQHIKMSMSREEWAEFAKEVDNAMKGNPIRDP